MVRLPDPALIEGRFTSRLRTPRVAAILGMSLALAFGTCFVTGVLSHLVQHPVWWSSWPTRPVSLYRVNQGIHVATGLAAIPLLLAKLWTVWPKLFAWPPVRGLAHAVERAFLLLLVGGAVLELGSGLANIALWYPFPFFFPTTHFWTAWVLVGAMLVHAGVKLAVARDSLRRGAAPEPASPGGMGRRAFLGTVAASAAVVTVATAGQTITPLRSVSLLAPRRADIGPQGLPVNKTAGSAGVRERAQDPAYRLVVAGAGELSLSLADLQALPQRTVRLPIACVEGWSAYATWTGVRVRDLLEAAGWDGDSDVRVESLQRSGRYRRSLLPGGHAADPLTLLALRVNGEPLALDHGFPCRLIAPSLPGVMQTKWVARLQVPA